MISRLATLIIACVIVCPVAIAQSSRPDSASKTEAKEADTDAKGLLAGPEIKQSLEDQTQIRFDGSTAGRGGRGRIAVPNRRWFALLRSLELSQEQDDEIRPIIQSLQKAAKEHATKRGKRIRQLQRQAQQARRKNRDIPRSVRQELAELRANGPKAETYQERIWELLTPSQQEQMRESLALIRQEIIKQRESRNTDLLPASDKAVKEAEQDKKIDDLDEQAQRRLDFLKVHQASDSPKSHPDR